jgi:hypothetical protein
MRSDSHATTSARTACDGCCSSAYERPGYLSAEIVWTFLAVSL